MAQTSKQVNTATIAHLDPRNMKIQIADINNEIVIAKDLVGMDSSLIGHLICELELIKHELLCMYDESDTRRTSL